MNRPGLIAAAILFLLAPVLLTAADPAELTPEQRTALEKKAAELNRKAMQLYQDGQYSQATQLLRQVLQMRQQLYPREKYPQGHPELAGSLNNLGFLLQAQGEYARAEPYFRDALAMWQKLYPADRYPQGHPELALSLNNLGFLLQAQGEYARAEPFLRDALAMYRKLYPADRYPQGHPDLAGSLNNLGFLLQAQGEYARAEPFLRDALAMYQKLYPADRYPQGHPDLARSLNNLGFLLQAQGEYARAERYYRDALAMLQKLYSADRYPQGHPDLATSLNNLGALLQAQGEYARAEPYYRDALAMYQAQLLRLADTAAEAEALNFAADQPLTRDGYLSTTRHLPADPAVYHRLWPSRSLLTRVLERRRLDLAAAGSPAARELASKLADARQRLSRLLLQPAGDPKEHAERLRVLSQAREDLERKLVQQLRLEQPARPDQTTPHQLGERLPARTAFMDLFRYVDFEQDPKVAGKKGERRTPRYAAFVLLPGQAARRVELGAAKALEEAWSAWRAALVAGKPDRDAAAAFARLAWQPIRAVLPADTHTLWLAPDGVLAQVP